MFSRPLAFLLLALGVVTAAAGGAYVATRHNAADSMAVAAPIAAAPAPTTGSTAQPVSQAVAETEAAVSSAKPSAEAPDPAVSAAKSPSPAPAPRREPAPVRATPASKSARVEKPAPHRSTPMNGASPATTVDPPATVAPAPAAEPIKPIEPAPEPPHVPQFEQLVLPAASVIGLQMESSLSSERARVEDRVEARVTRDVMSGGRVAIPAGARVIGSVTLVDKGGKVKTPARLGIRFHTLILSDGTEVALNTEPFYREGESPAGSSSKKIGGAAVGGAILGAILGGGKGAAIGGATGAAGGTAVVMAGDRSVVNVPPGTIVNAKLTAPATITVERRDQDQK
jgi:hypothetical protein